MAGFIDTSLSGLNAYQRALAVTSNNIANANTEGYSRQRIELDARPAALSSGGQVGRGVQVANVSRVYDDFVQGQIRTSTASFHKADTLEQLSNLASARLGDADSGLESSLSRFNNSIQTLANEPGSTTARSMFLQEADALASRFRSLDGDFQNLSREVGRRLQDGVVDANGLITEISELNDRVLQASAAGSPANSLRDARDTALAELSQLLDIHVVEDRDQSVSVYLGDGQALVLEGEVFSLSAGPDPLDNSRTQISLDTRSGSLLVSGSIQGGEIGGALTFRDDVLEPAKGELGLLAYGLADTLNGLQAQGLDLSGNAGRPLFSVPEPGVTARPENSGNAALTVSRGTLGSLGSADLLLHFNGSDYEAVERGSGQVLAVSGSGTGADPILVAGLSITLSGTPAEGDAFLLQPQSQVAAGISLALRDPAGLAAAGAILAYPDSSNTGSGSITQGLAANADDPAFFNGARIQFVDAGSYSVDGSGSFSYQAGAAITVNGTELVIDGVPNAGDVFVLSPNRGASGDNRNALAMAAFEELQVFSGGAKSLTDSVVSLSSQLALQTRSASLDRDSQEIQLQQNQARRESVSGVNLDEEAANLLRYQQSYQAAAQAVAVANTLFDTLINAVR